MKTLIKKAGLTPGVLKDPAKRTAVIHEFNAKSGGLRLLMKKGKLELASTHPIASSVSRKDLLRYIEFAGAGRQIPIIFAAGRATRMKFPGFFDRLGIGGLTPRILSELDKIRGDREETLDEEIDHSEEAHRSVEQAVFGAYSDPSDLSFVQRMLMQYCYQTEKLIRDNPDCGLTMLQWLSKAHFAVVANEENKKALGKQLAAIHFGGLRPEHIYFIVQPEETGYEILGDGRLEPYTEFRWPEGHGKPFIDMRSDKKAAYRLHGNGKLVPLGRTFIQELVRQKIDRAMFAQVNDLHLLNDMVHVTRWLAADALIAKGADMVMEMVENGLKQKGGGIFKGKKGAVMRDTIAMQSKDLATYAIPASLSRMFYILTTQGMSKITAKTLPAYISERKTSDGRAILTREYCSGDASGALKSAAIQEPSYELFTFKMQSRIPVALDAVALQDRQTDFLKVIHR